MNRAEGADLGAVAVDAGFGCGGPPAGPRSGKLWLRNSLRFSRVHHFFNAWVSLPPLVVVRLVRAAFVVDPWGIKIAPKFPSLLQNPNVYMAIFRGEEELSELVSLRPVGISLCKSLKLAG